MTKELDKNTAKLTRKSAIDAHCHQCMGYHLDGKADCENSSCPLYPFNPKAKLEPVTDWLAFNPRRVGQVTWEESRQELTDDERAKRAARLNKNMGRNNG